MRRRFHQLGRRPSSGGRFHRCSSGRRWGFGRAGRCIDRPAFFIFVPASSFRSSGVLAERIVQQWVGGLWREERTWRKRAGSSR